MVPSNRSLSLKYVSMSTRFWFVINFISCWFCRKMIRRGMWRRQIPSREQNCIVLNILSRISVVKLFVWVQFCRKYLLQTICWIHAVINKLEKWQKNPNLLQYVKKQHASYYPFFYVFGQEPSSNLLFFRIPVKYWCMSRNDSPSGLCFSINYVPYV